MQRNVQRTYQERTRDSSLARARACAVALLLHLFEVLAGEDGLVVRVGHGNVRDGVGQVDLLGLKRVAHGVFVGQQIARHGLYGIAFRRTSCFCFRILGGSGQRGSFLLHIRGRGIDVCGSGHRSGILLLNDLLNDLLSDWCGFLNGFFSGLFSGDVLLGLILGLKGEARPQIINLTGKLCIDCCVEKRRLSVESGSRSDFRDGLRGLLGIDRFRNQLALDVFDSGRRGHLLLGRHAAPGLHGLRRPLHVAERQQVKAGVHDVHEGVRLLCSHLRFVIPHVGAQASGQDVLLADRRVRLVHGDGRQVRHGHVGRHLGRDLFFLLLLGLQRVHRRAQIVQALRGSGDGGGLRLVVAAGLLVSLAAPTTALAVCDVLKRRGLLGWLLCGVHWLDHGADALKICGSAAQRKRMRKD
eukprot:scaffold3071_cov253-Pinguiococcus_pyrenoidosus.AAC.3